MRSGLWIGLVAVIPAWLPWASGAAAEPQPIRIASGVAGHIHPAVCLSRSGAIVVVFGQSDFRDLRLTRSTDGGRTWSEPAAFRPAVEQWIYPGSLTTLADGRIVHFWNRWLGDGRKEPRYPVYSVSTDDGRTWSAEQALPKSERFPRVVRHPLVELADGRWLVSCSDGALTFDPMAGTTTPFGDGRSDPPGPTRAVVPIVRTPKGTLVSGYGLRSTDEGRTWRAIESMPDVRSQGWRHDLAVLRDGTLIASEVVGPGIGGDAFRYVASHDDGITWSTVVEFYNPGRPIGGRACPRAVQLDDATVGIVFYDVEMNQPGGPGLFFLRLPVAKFRGAKP